MLNPKYVNIYGCDKSKYSLSKLEKQIYEYYPCEELEEIRWQIGLQTKTEAHMRLKSLG